MGVVLIRNLLTDKVFLTARVDLKGTINRQRFQLSNGIHPILQLQADWDEVGENNFAFEIVAQLTSSGDQKNDLADL